MSDGANSDHEARTQRERRVAIDTTLGPDAILLTDVDGAETLSHCFLYKVYFITQRADREVRSLLGRPVTLWLNNDHQAMRRPINGRIRRISQEDDTIRGFATYRAEVVPQLWFLDCTADCRIFQQQSVPDIVEDVLRDHGLTHFEFRLHKRDYPVLDFCVQYRESALAFVSRLLEDVGIFYCHEHYADRHVLVMLDDNSMASYTEPRQVRVANRADLGDILSFRMETVFRPGRWAQTDYDFQAPSKIMHKRVKTLMPVEGTDQYEIFDFPGGYTDQAVGDWLTRLRMEAEEAQHVAVHGIGSLTALDPGRRMQVVDGTQDRGRDPLTYLLTEVRHHARERSYSDSTPDQTSEYRNEFVAIPQATPFRPQRVTPKPVVHGLQTATVVSPDKADPIYTDMYGRIKVHFHWDRRGDCSKGNTSCWVRVSQVNAGSSAGSISIPHAGQEVVVAFLEGDPDRPLIVGRLHNAEKLPPLVLPRDKHKTEIRDHGNNKLIMHGKPGQEHLSLVTPRSLNLVAMRPPARSLSASAAQEFSDIEDWQDGTGLSEVKTIFDALTQYQTQPPYGSFGGGTPGPSPATVPDSNPTGLTLAGPSNQDDTGALGIDINSFTDGRSNVVTLGNNNTWCYGTYNTWVHDWAQSKFCGGNYQEIFKENLQIVWGSNTQQTMGASEQLTEGDSTQITLLLSEQLIFGGSLTMTMPYAVIINAGYQWTLSAATEKHVSPDSDTNCVGAWSVEAGGMASITAGADLVISATGVMETTNTYTMIANLAYSVSTEQASISMLPAAVYIKAGMGIVVVQGTLLKLG